MKRKKKEEERIFNNIQQRRILGTWQNGNQSLRQTFEVKAPQKKIECKTSSIQISANTGVPHDKNLHRSTKLVPIE
jgi:hypothetical protein